MAGTSETIEGMEPRGSAAAGGFALPDRFHWLDFLRFLAALAVVTHHYYFFYFDGLKLPIGIDGMRSSFPFPFVNFFFDYGQYAVQFFWVLSGFVFAHTYFRRPSDGFGFAVARFARLYPLHFATLIAVLVLQTISVGMTSTPQIIRDNDAYHFMLQIFFVSSWGFEAGNSFNAPIWSVSSEIGAYMVFYLLHRNGLFQTVAGQALAVLTAVALSRMIGPGTVVACCAFFFSGCMVYLLVRDRRPIDFAIVCVLMLYALEFPDALMMLTTPMTAWIPVFATIVFVVSWVDIGRVPGGAAFGHLGDFTYSMYLIHMPLIVGTLLAVRAARVTGKDYLSSPAMFGAYLCTVVALAIVSYRKFERPADRAIRAWACRRRAAAVETATVTRAA